MYEYLATLKKGFSLNQEAKASFESQKIRIKKYYPRFGILKVYTKKPLDADAFDFIESLELEREFIISKEEEE